MNVKTKRNAVRVISLICSSFFTVSAVLPLGINTGKAITAERDFPFFAHMSALSAPAEKKSADEHTVTEPVNVTEPPTEESAKDDGAKIIPVELSLSDGSGDILFKNETSYTFDTGTLLSAGYPIEPADSGPAVLIIHTHATESYAREGAQTVTETRSSDPEENMIAVGRVLCEALEENGVEALHCTEMHDAQSYNEAYSLSAKSVKEYLEKYPTLKYIIDVHRDAITVGEGDMAKPVAEKDGTALAQLMLVVGTDEGGADHPGWKTNLCVAVRTQKALTEYHHTLARPINLRSASFNQQLSPGFLLLEVGSCANTLSEAKASAEVFGEVFASLILDP